MVPVVLGQLVALILGACDVWFARICNIIVNLILNLLDQYISWSMVIWFRLFRAFNSMRFLADFLHTATQVLSILFLLHCSSIYLLIFLFSFFVCVYSKFWVNLSFELIYVNLSTLCHLLFYNFSLISYHPHLLTLSHSQPPASHLPPPSPGWSKPLISHSAYTSGQWTVEWDYNVFRI